MKKLGLLILVITSFALKSQTDLLNQVNLDNLDYDQLYQHYLSEKEPIQFYKGPDIGDSIFYLLRPQTIPTQTVHGQSLLWHQHLQDVLLSRMKVIPEEASSDTFEIKKPKISLGTGRLAFHGDLGKKHFQMPQTARLGFDLGISQRITRYMQLDFTVLFGKLSASERLLNRQENFLSEIRAGGINLLYDFGNILPDKYTMRPYVSFGVMGFEFLSKTDLKDANGNAYNYWSDGSIKNMPEGSAEAQNAINIQRDYKYESDIRELNKDGFGKYRENAWAFPFGFGFVLKVTDRVDAKINYQYFVSTTDNIDGISNKSIGNRVGNKRRDNFAYTSISLQYDLVARKKQKIVPVVDSLDKEFWLAFDKDDSDGDGVLDLRDACPGTPDGAKVNLKGCPLDEDNDGVPNYKDEELNTPPRVSVNMKGVGLTDEYWQNWYNAFMNDTSDLNMTVEDISNFYDLAKANKKKKKRAKDELYTVEIARYTGAIPSEELAFMLSIGDIDTKTLEDGTTVVYTNLSNQNILNLIKRRDEFKSLGIKTARISKIVGNKFIPLTDEELEALKKEELSEGENGQNADGFNSSDVVYRVQLGAFKNRISTNVFNTSAGSVLEIKTGENIYRYVTKGYKTMVDAAAVRADLVIQGYDDAFVTAYKNGNRIPLNQTTATVDKEFKEDLREDKMFSSVNKQLVLFKIQFGPPKKKIFESAMDEKYKDVPDLIKETTNTGNVRYTSGNFHTKEDAEKYLKNIETAGFNDAFIIAKFKNEIISIQEALELLAN